MVVAGLGIGHVASTLEDVGATERSNMRPNAPNMIATLPSVIQNDHNLRPVINSGHPMLRKIAATKFKEQCLALLEKLPADGIVITKHGRMLARVMPYREGNAELIGSLAEKIVIDGDLQTTGVAWDADGQP